MSNSEYGMAGLKDIRYSLFDILNSSAVIGDCRS
jgi:hypothetical protein